jgi:hypothetical protein
MITSKHISTSAIQHHISNSAAYQQFSTISAHQNQNVISTAKCVPQRIITYQVDQLPHE